jgi:hypothetical protein
LNGPASLLNIAFFPQPSTNVTLRRGWGSQNEVGRGDQPTRCVAWTSRARLKGFLQIYVGQGPLLLESIVGRWNFKLRRGAGFNPCNR